MTAFTQDVPAGSVGHITDMRNADVVSRFLDGTNTPTVFGRMIKIASQKARILPASATLLDCHGVVARVVPQIQTSSAQHGFNNNAPNAELIQSIIKKGPILVECVAGTPAPGTGVFVVINTAGGDELGEFRATADSTNTLDISTIASWESDGKETGTNIAELRLSIA